MAPFGVLRILILLKEDNAPPTAEDKILLFNLKVSIISIYASYMLFNLTEPKFGLSRIK